MRGYLAVARHTAWAAADEAELLRWAEVIERTGTKVTPRIRHETMESIYFLDPNGYPLEISRQIRPLSDPDRLDAELTIEAMIETFGDDNPEGRTIHDMWQAKGRLVADRVFDGH